MRLLEIRPELYRSIGDPAKDLRIASMLLNLGKLFVEYLRDVYFDNCKVIWMVFTNPEDSLVENLTAYDGRETIGIARTTGILTLEPEFFSDQEKLLACLADSIAEALRVYFKKANMPTEELDEALLKVKNGDYFALYGMRIKVPGKRIKTEIVVREKCIFSKRIFRFDLQDGDIFFSSYTPELEIKYAKELPQSERNNFDIVMEKIPYLKVEHWTDRVFFDFSYGQHKFQYSLASKNIVIL